MESYEVELDGNTYQGWLEMIEKSSDILLCQKMTCSKIYVVCALYVQHNIQTWSKSAD